MVNIDEYSVYFNHRTQLAWTNISMTTIAEMQIPEKKLIISLGVHNPIA